MERYSLQDLKEAVKKLSGSDENFAGSILDQWSERGYISEKQMYWVGKLVEKARAPKLGPAGLVRISQLFRKAKDAGLKRPKIEIAPGVVIVRAGPASSRPDSLYVKGGRSYESVYYGRIDPDGNFSASDNADDEVFSALLAWSQDPAKAAKAYGHQHGNCCFCGRDLDDPRSVAMGYGPVCAENYGLPWGDQKVSGELLVEA